MSDINEWEHLQSTLIRVQNRIVRDSFRADLDIDNLTIPESALRHACLIKDNDTTQMVSLRLKLFYDIRESGNHGMPPIFALPDFHPHQFVKGKPQVIFTFSEKTDAWKARGAKRRKQVRVSYRIMDRDSEAVTEAQLRQLATAINATFPRSWSFKTGRYKVSYRDKEHGWDFITAPYTVPDGKELISRVLSLEGSTPDWSLLSVSEHPNRNYRERRTARVLGKTKELDEQRQIATTVLDKVEVHLYGSLQNIVLIDRAVSHRLYGRHQELYG
ncbi:hypothetical protein [Leptothoe spongobia]|uniref:Uncharacterized protein n=1 Tax=Leptothoe spongobia TAU-MAC 1115 TaxID=1967444 RepID=A0A947GKP4_9CYAN|nr:hypothetical protein [Leptothoe spongobia]MBT9314381.1 hypothetical protein [Leptothoe spongobia TAU-MAC 1115]